MEDPKSNNASQHARRKILKKVGGAGAAIITSTQIPSQWLKPIVEVAILPAHAQSSPNPLPRCPSGCDTNLALAGADLPSVCSGGVWPPITFFLAVSQGCDNIVITSISTNLPGSGSVSALSVGTQLTAGSTAQIVVHDLEDSSASNATCQPPATAASVTISYSCVGLPAQTKTVEINLTSALL